MSNRRFFAICSFMLLLSLACSSCSTAKDTISSDVQSTPPTTASDSTTLMDDSEPISTASFVKAGNGPLVSLRAFMKRKLSMKIRVVFFTQIRFSKSESIYVEHLTAHMTMKVALPTFQHQAALTRQCF